MLEKIREGAQGPWAMAIIVLIVLSFVFAGVGSYLTAPTNTAAAVVNGEDISQATLEQAYQNQRARMEAQFGEGFAALFADSSYMASFRKNVLDQLIGEKLMEQKAEALGLRVSDKQVRETIVSLPEFQTLGQFDNDRYLALLRQSGFQASTFREYMRTQLTREQLARTLLNSDFVLPVEINATHMLQSQLRDGRFLTVAADMFTKDVTINEEDISGYYNANITQFDTEEQVSLEYVLLAADQLASEQTVQADDIAEYYQANQASYTTEEKRRVSHILLEFTPDREAAVQKMSEVQAALEAGEAFADVAKRFSNDTFSAENGGDLDFITAGMMDPAFDAAAFALRAEGDVSEVVETEFGLHLIQLTALVPQQVTPLSDVANDIEATLRQEKALDKFFALQNDMSQAAFEVSDSLEEVAAVANVSVQTTPLFARGQLPAAINFPQVESAVFASELIEQGVNSELIDLGDNRVMVARVKQHEPSRTRALEEVTTDIRRTLVDERALQAAEAFAQDIKAKLLAKEDISSVLTEKGLTWTAIEQQGRGGAQIPQAVVDTLFALSLDEGQQANTTVVAARQVALVELSNVTAAGPIEEGEAEVLRQGLNNLFTQRLYEDVIEQLKADADIVYPQ